MEIVAPPLAFRGRIAEFDAFRGSAILVVILAHVWPVESSRVSTVLQLAWVLMDGFFVMSGYLIAGLLLDNRAKPDYYRTFYTRRALRILPIYYVVIGATTLVAVLSGSPSYRRMLEMWGSPTWFFVYLGNIPTALSGSLPHFAGGAFVPLWSLQIEEQFYLLFPLLVRRLSNRNLVRVLLGLFCVSPMLRVLIYWWN